MSQPPKIAGNMTLALAQAAAKALHTYSPTQPQIQALKANVSQARTHVEGLMPRAMQAHLKAGVRFAAAQVPEGSARMAFNSTIRLSQLASQVASTANRGGRVTGNSLQAAMQLAKNELRGFAQQARSEWNGLRQAQAGTTPDAAAEQPAPQPAAQAAPAAQATNPRHEAMPLERKSQPYANAHSKEKFRLVPEGMKDPRDAGKAGEAATASASSQQDAKTSASTAASGATPSAASGHQPVHPMQEEARKYLLQIFPEAADQSLSGLRLEAQALANSHVDDPIQLLAQQQVKPVLHDLALLNLSLALGVPLDAGDKAMRSAAKKAMLALHPDKLAQKPPEEKKRLESEFKKLNAEFTDLQKYAPDKAL